jgi:hypothetical protein
VRIYCVEVCRFVRSKFRQWAILASLCGCLLAPLSFAQQASGHKLDALKFLIGDWVGEGGGTPGEGKGGFSIHPDLQETILVRKNFAEYPATKDRPAYRHDDLMIFYFDSISNSMRAFYTDNEGHVIDYVVSVSEDGKTCSLVSGMRPDVPRYRQTLNETQPGHLKITFEIAPIGKPDQFVEYIEATAHKTAD